MPSVQLVTLGSGLSFLCRFLLWFYLKVFAARANQFGQSFKSSIEELRALESSKRLVRELKKRKKQLRRGGGISLYRIESEEGWKTDGSSSSTSSRHCSERDAPNIHPIFRLALPLDCAASLTEHDAPLLHQYSRSTLPCEALDTLSLSMPSSILSSPSSIGLRCLSH